MAAFLLFIFMLWFFLKSLIKLQMPKLTCPCWNKWAFGAVPDSFWIGPYLTSITAISALIENVDTEGGLKGGVVIFPCEYFLKIFLPLAYFFYFLHVEIFRPSWRVRKLFSEVTKVRFRLRPGIQGEAPQPSGARRAITLLPLIHFYF